MAHKPSGGLGGSHRCAERCNHCFGCDSIGLSLSGAGLSPCQSQSSAEGKHEGSMWISTSRIKCSVTARGSLSAAHAPSSGMRKLSPPYSSPGPLTFWPSSSTRSPRRRPSALSMRLPGTLS